MKIHQILCVMAVSLPGLVLADSVSVSGPIESTGARVQANTFVQAGTYVVAGSYITATTGEIKATANRVYAGTYLYSPGYVYTGQNGVAAFPNPLILAGNGASGASLANAFAVYKDGTVTMGKAQGDISMGQFGN